MIPKYSTIEGSLDNNSNNRIKRNNQQFVPISKRTVQLRRHVKVIGQPTQTNNIINLMFIYHIS